MMLNGINNFSFKGSAACCFETKYEDKPEYTAAVHLASAYMAAEKELAEAKTEEERKKAEKKLNAMNGNEAGAANPQVREAFLASWGIVENERVSETKKLIIQKRLPGLTPCEAERLKNQRIFWTLPKAENDEEQISQLRALGFVPKESAGWNELNQLKRIGAFGQNSKVNVEFLDNGNKKVEGSVDNYCKINDNEDVFSYTRKRTYVFDKSSRLLSITNTELDRNGYVLDEVTAYYDAA